MGQDDGSGPQGECRAEDLPGLQGRNVETAHRHLLAANRLVSRIQVEDGKDLAQTRPQVLELEERLTRRGHRRCRRIRRDVPAASQLADRQQASHLGWPESVSPGRHAEIAGRPLDDATLGQKRSHSRKVPPLSDERGQQPGFIGRRHARILTQICIYVHAEA